MMREGFDHVVSALWTSLGLARPRIDEQERAVLRIDGRSVAFVRSPDELHLVITTAVGSLSSDRYRREEQMRALMRDSLGLMLTNCAGLQLADEGEAPVVEAVAVGPCSAGQVPLLRDVIEDVLHLADIHATTLDARARGVAVERPEADFRDSVIFRL